MYGWTGGEMEGRGGGEGAYRQGGVDLVGLCGFQWDHTKDYANF